MLLTKDFAIKLFVRCYQGIVFLLGILTLFLR